MAQSIDLNSIKDQLADGAGGYEVAHTSPGLELGVPDALRASSRRSVAVALAASTLAMLALEVLLVA